MKQRFLVILAFSTFELLACGHSSLGKKTSPPDGGTVDAGPPGTIDAGVPDSGAPDAGPSDAGPSCNSQSDPLNCGTCGHICLRGTCTAGLCGCVADGGDCASNETCGEGGLCRPATDLCANVQCAAGSVCRGGTCQVISCSSDSGSCGPGERCDPDGLCRLPSCTDGIKNGAETGLDCGGGTCSACPAGQLCLAASDCTSDVCTGNVCQAPTCSDAVKNGAETDVDCGGGTCPGCAVGKTCSTTSDCTTALACDAQVCKSGCSISSSFFVAGAPNPSNACQSCQPSVSTSAWSLVPEGTACDDGNACTYGDACSATGACGGTPITCTSDQCNTLTCNGTATCTVTPNAGSASVTIAAPLSGMQINSNRTVVQGTTTPGSAASAIPISSVEVSASGGPWVAAVPRSAGDWSAWTADLGALSPAPQVTLAARATDACGNVVSTSVSVTVLATSALFGVAGELWQRGTGRLPDVSWSGYAQGERPIPGASSDGGVPNVINVRDFGASGDGGTDDTLAIANAIDAGTNGAIYFPPGKYKITNRLYVTRSNVVLRGAGPGLTTLYFPKSLWEVDSQGCTCGNDGGCCSYDAGCGVCLTNPTQYSYQDAYINFKPASTPCSGRVFPIVTGARLKATLTADAARGDTILQVDTSASITAGQVLVLAMQDDATRTLQKHMHADQFDPSTLNPDTASPIFSWPVRIDRVIDSQHISLAQPLRLDARTAWGPPVLADCAGASEVGIEHITLEFAGAQYPGHHLEQGYNGISFVKDIRNGWVDDVEFVNADSGIFVNERTKWITLSNVSYRATRLPDATGRTNATGHHAMAFSRTADSLVSNFHYETQFIHGLTVTHQANGNAFTGVTASPGISTNLDHHRDEPFENVFTHITPETHFQVSGDLSYGPNSAARGTFWNLGGAVGAPPYSLPDPVWAKMQTNFIGPMDSSVTPLQTPLNEWFERIPAIYPADLLQAERAYRDGGL